MTTDWMSLGRFEAVAAAAFVSTNIDNFFLLVLLFSEGPRRRREVWAGEFIGTAVLVAVSLVGAAATLAMPSSWLRWLGVIPMGVGVMKLLAMRGGAREEPTVVPVLPTVMTVVVLAVSNGSDNVAVYIPLFAHRSFVEISLAMAMFAVLTAGWCFAASAVVNHPSTGRVLRRLGPRMVPIVLIGLGAFLVASRFSR